IGLPSGLTVNTSTGAISGTTTTNGNFNVTVSATNAGGTGSATLALHIDPPAPTITSAGTASGTAESSFFYQITANQAIPSGGWGTTVSIPGVSFSTTTGAFSGTPTAAGTFNGNITATNANGTGTKTLSVTIAPQPHTFPTAIAAISPPAVYTGDTVTLDASASDTNPPGGTLTYVWQQTAPGSPTNSVNPTFMAPPFTPPNGMSYTFTLVVTEQRPNLPPKNSLPDQVVIMVKQPPIALASLVNDINNISSEGNAGESSCSYTTTVTLYGFGVDPDTDSFTYAWTQVHDTGGAPVQPGVDTVADLQGKTSATPSFTAPDVPNGQQ